MPLGSSLLNYTTGGRRQLWDILLLPSGASQAVISDEQAKFGNTSLKLSAVNTGGSLSNALLGAIDWAGYANGVPLYPYITIEFFFYSGTNASSHVFFDTLNTDTAWEWDYMNDRTSVMSNQDFSGGSEVTDSITSAALTASTWHHIAMVRSQDTWGYWTNGDSQGTFTNTDFRENGNERRFRGAMGGLVRLPWYMDELRISSVARYNPGTNFTPPAAPFVNDLDTVCLYHFEGTNGDTTTQDDNL